MKTLTEYETEARSKDEDWCKYRRHVIDICRASMYRPKPIKRWDFWPVRSHRECPLCGEHLGFTGWYESMDNFGGDTVRYYSCGAPCDYEYATGL